MSLPENWPATVAVPGVVSEGTLRSEDLAAAFFPVLVAIKPEEAQRLLLKYHPGDDLGEYVVELMDALDELAPEGYYFGTVEGDGACFGFFESPDYEDDEDEMPESNEVCAARGMIALYELVKSDWQVMVKLDDFHEAYVAAGEVLNARGLA